ncbi:DDE-type integrase/transposase/recombinase [Shewanella gelidimarina]|nr:DDE-type integrase/transposase/recombinase [Shewanella gelidimarina]MCL1058677.1 DDE-type integrase/transposase/recombinase [Shewanella gelidimarina]
MILDDTWYLDEVFIKINDVLHYLWRAVDQDGDEIDILVQKRKDKRAAMCFLKRLLKGEGSTPLKVVTDKLASYSAAKKELMPSAEHSTVQYENNGYEYLISLLGNRNDRCVNLNLRVKLNGFLVVMEW